MPTRPERARMAMRRFLYVLREIRWWAFAALLLGLLGVVLALTEQDIETVLAVGILALVTAVLATRET